MIMGSAISYSCSSYFKYYDTSSLLDFGPSTEIPIVTEFPSMAYTRQYEIEFWTKLTITFTGSYVLVRLKTGGDNYIDIIVEGTGSEVAYKMKVFEQSISGSVSIANSKWALVSIISTTGLANSSLYFYMSVYDPSSNMIPPQMGNYIRGENTSGDNRITVNTKLIFNPGSSPALYGSKLAYLFIQERKN